MKDRRLRGERPRRGERGLRRLVGPAFREPWLLAGVLVAASVLRLVRLGSQSLWLDESVSSDFVHLHLRSLLLAVRSNESTPPLYYVLAWVWAKVFGSSEIGVRSLSVVLGVA